MQALSRMHVEDYFVHFSVCYIVIKTMSPKLQKSVDRKSVIFVVFKLSVLENGDGIQTAYSNCHWKRCNVTLLECLLSDIDIASMVSRYYTNDLLLVC